MGDYRPREMEPALGRLAGTYRVLVVTGPRQAGKTSLVRRVFPDHAYLNLENLDERAFADEDPRGFLNRHGGGVVIDEVQRCPGLLSYIQVMVDEDPRPAPRGKGGSFSGKSPPWTFGGSPPPAG